ncbi:MAG: KTSC domain-containing protein [Symploca sp. SIO2G7]|nr:KTSC domain-containing protein [Symploca sp. SIO2G7]
MIYEAALVNSTAIRLIGYSVVTNTLRVIFRSGSGYDYSNVPVEVFEELLAAESIGTYFQLIRATYQFERLSRVAAQDFLFSAIAQAEFTRLQIEVAA